MVINLFFHVNVFLFVFGFVFVHAWSLWLLIGCIQVILTQKLCYKVVWVIETRNTRELEWNNNLIYKKDWTTNWNVLIKQFHRRICFISPKQKVLDAPLYSCIAQILCSYFFCNLLFFSLPSFNFQISFIIYYFLVPCSLALVHCHQLVHFVGVRHSSFILVKGVLDLIMIVTMFEKPMILMSISWIFEVVLGKKLWFQSWRAPNLPKYGMDHCWGGEEFNNLVFSSRCQTSSTIFGTKF